LRPYSWPTTQPISAALKVAGCCLTWQLKPDVQLYQSFRGTRTDPTPDGRGWIGAAHGARCPWHNLADEREAWRGRGKALAQRERSERTVHSADAVPICEHRLDHRRRCGGLPRRILGLTVATVIATVTSVAISAAIAVIAISSATTRYPSELHTHERSTHGPSTARSTSMSRHRHSACAL
jgi:hypothetical protein